LQDSNQDVDYDPFLLDDPNLKSGKHRTVMTLPGFMESVIAWVQESEYLKELNEQFKLKHPNLPASLSLSKIRKMKRLFLETTTHLDLEVSTAVLAILYFETLCLKCLVDKVNRKLVSATCFFLAFKFNEAGPHHSVTLAKLLEVCLFFAVSFPFIFFILLDLSLQTLESTFDVRRFDIFRSEFDVLVELDFNLHFTSAHVLPHFARVLQQLELVAQEYLGTQMYSDVYGINEDIGLGEVDEDDQHQHEIDVERSMHEHDQADSHELRVQIDPDDEVLINTSMMNTSFLSN
jgi:hypothetical protein